MVTEPGESLRRSRLPTGALLASVSVLGGLAIGWVSYQHSRQLVVQSQDRVQAALAKGLVVALSDQLVLNDYAGMESRLQQAMADPSLASAVVTDPNGRVLVHLERERPEAEPRLEFEPARITPPENGPSSSSRSGSISTRWTAIDAGLEPLGWLQLRTWSTSTDAVLSLLARQYLVLSTLTAALLGTLMASARQQIRRQGLQRERVLRQVNTELEQEALTDPLTGVWNRRGVERELRSMLDTPRTPNREKLAVCMIDLDDFKPVNDTYGHAIGDQVLIAVTRRIGGALRKGDLLGRIGGDELIVVFRGCSEAAIACELAKRIVARLKAPFIFDHLEIRIGASIGIALNAGNVDEPMHSLLQRADQAMYATKEAGKGHLVIAEDPVLVEPPGEAGPPPAGRPRARHP